MNLNELIDQPKIERYPLVEGSDYDPELRRDLLVYIGGLDHEVIGIANGTMLLLKFIED